MGLKVYIVYQLVMVGWKGHVWNQKVERLFLVVKGIKPGPEDFTIDCWLSFSLV